MLLWFTTKVWRNDWNGMTMIYDLQQKREEMMMRRLIKLILRTHNYKELINLIWFWSRNNLRLWCSFSLWNQIITRRDQQMMIWEEQTHRIRRWYKMMRTKEKKKTRTENLIKSDKSKGSNDDLKLIREG